MQQIVEVGSREHAVTNPLNTAQIVALTLLHIKVDINTFFVVGYNAVGQYAGIAVAKLGIARKNVLLVLLILFGGELFGAQEGVLECAQTGLFAHLHRIFYLFQGNLFHSVYIYAVYLYLLVLIDIHIHNHLVIGCNVGALNNVHFGIVIALVLEVLLHYFLCTVNDVGGNLVTLAQRQFKFKVLTLALLHTVVVDV